LPQSEADKAVDEYFLGTSIVDLNNLAKTAISFNALKDELAKIPSRQVLVLVDACHAGEQESVDERPPGSGIILPGVQQYRSNSTSPPPNISAAFGLMKELFADMRRGSGAVVLAAAAGNQYAKDTGKSGLFTWCVLQGLQGAADTNADQNVTVEELVTYVGDEVERQSAGGQRPNTRQENLDNDFVVGRTLASLPQPPKAPVKAPANKPSKKKKRGGR